MWSVLVMSVWFVLYQVGRMLLSGSSCTKLPRAVVSVRQLPSRSTFESHCSAGESLAFDAGLRSALLRPRTERADSTHVTLADPEAQNGPFACAQAR